MEEPGRLQSMGSLESDTTERLHFHFSLSCTGEGNGNPLQCSCLENPRAWGACWAAVYGVAQSRTRLKRLSSSSSRPAYRFLKRQIRWSGIPTSFRIFHSLLWPTQSKALASSIKQKWMFFWNSLAFSMIWWMLAIWSLVPLPFLNSPWRSESSRFTYCWSLAWRILSITFLACEMSTIVR